jgi:hypothetical protein
MLSMLPGSSTRRIVLAVLVAVGIAVAGAGVTAAHNPACHQVAATDGPGPHYDGAGGSQTASQTAFEKNKNLGGSDFGGPDHAADGCSVGNSQSPHSDN